MVLRLLDKLKFYAELALPSPISLLESFSGGALVRQQGLFSALAGHEPRYPEPHSPCRTPHSNVFDADKFCERLPCYHHVCWDVHVPASRFISSQKRYMSTPKIKLKVDRTLDAYAEIDKRLRPIFKVKALILRQESKFIKVRYLDIKRKHIGISGKPVRARGFLKRFPNMFELFTFPRGIHLYCRLTPAVLGLLEEERQIYLDTEDEIVLKLRKLLMMSKDRRIKVGKLDLARRAFGFPADFASRIVPAYPLYFRILGSGPSPFIHLVEWDEKLAIAELEKKTKEEALKEGKGEIQTRGQPLEFKITNSPGMFLKKKSLELLERWQKLPYVSPYQDYSWVPKGTALAQKRAAAVLHEVLSLTIDKRALLLLLGRFREEFGLPQAISKLVNGLPGIFYVSLMGNIKTVFLREAYVHSQHIENYVRLGKKEAHIIEDHPLLHWRMKIAQMAWEGPRMHAAEMERARECKRKGVISPDKLSDSDEADEDAGSGISDFDFEDSECEDLVTEDEHDAVAEEEQYMGIQEKQVRAKKEIW